MWPKNSPIGINERILQWNPREQVDPALHPQLGETRMTPRDDPVMVEMPGPPARPEAATGSTQYTTTHAPESPAISIPNSVSGFEESSGSTRDTIYNKSISPNAVTNFPMFENTYNQITHRRPDHPRLMSEASSHRSEKEEFQDIFSELMTGTEHEIAFLTRHFSEVIGPWYVQHTFLFAYTVY